MAAAKQTWTVSIEPVSSHDIGAVSLCYLVWHLQGSMQRMHRLIHYFVIVLCVLTTIPASSAQTSGVINYQGRVMVGATLFTGTAQLKFALVNADGTKTYWNNAALGVGGSEPASAVSVAVTTGLYNVALGDASLPNMASIPSAVFADAVSQTATNPIFLRVWFNDGVNGSQLLVPDTRLTPVAFAMAASYAQTAQSALSVPDGSISAAKLAPGILPSGITAVSPNPADKSLLDGGYQSFYEIPAPAWNSGSTAGQPAARVRHQGVWTGSELFVWGGQAQGPTLLDDGGLYDPVANSWKLVPANASINARQGHTLIWTGQRAIVWGGMSVATVLNTGGLFDPSTRSWTDKTSITNAPAARQNHVAVWTGEEMFIWGGKNQQGTNITNFALYNPKADTWRNPSTTGVKPAPAAGTLGVWTGTEVILLGGAGAVNADIRSAFNPNTLVWRNLSATAAPISRTDHSVVWTGDRMLVWGGKGTSGVLADGAVYDPKLDTWKPISTVNAPSARALHSAVWTGREMLILGGATPAGLLSSGFAYNPATDSWRPLTTAGTPTPRSGSVAVWTGAQTLIYGGNGQNSVILAALQSLIPQPAWYFYRHP